MSSELGYYGGFPEFSTAADEDNLIGYGIDYEAPLNLMDEENLVTGVRHIRQCIFDILTTPIGSRFFGPEYGSKLNTVYYESNDFIACDLAETYTRDAIKKWEPRVEVLDVVASISDKEIGKMNLLIKYRIKNTNEIDSFVYSYNRQVPEMV